MSNSITVLVNLIALARHSPTLNDAMRLLIDKTITADVSGILSAIAWYAGTLG